jgi:hypothetical protein
VEQTCPSMVDLAVQPCECTATLRDRLVLEPAVESWNRTRNLDCLFVVERESPVGPGVAAQLRNRARVVHGLGCGCDDR